MAYSYTNYTGNGSTTQFSVPMPYIRKEHIHVYVNNVEVSFTWVNSTTALLASAPVNGAVVQVRRVTPLPSVLVDFSDGSTIVAADLDTSNLQHLYTEQELDDNSKQAIYVDPATGQLTAGGQKIGNVGTPTVGTDAATKSYVDGADAAVVAAVATNAATAASSATSATAAKVAAEAARDQTLSVYDSFDDRYLGPKTSNPTLDNDGNALVGGALYYNTVAQEMRLWTGSSWVTAYVSGNAAGIGFSPSGNIAAVNVQSAIQELDNEKMPLAGFANYQEFTSNGTWTKPTGVANVYVECINGGGGGGSGRRGATSTLRCGGHGGLGGVTSSGMFLASSLPSSVSVTVGLGGAGGAAVTVDSTNGSSGVAGGKSSFGSYLGAATPAFQSAGGSATLNYDNYIMSPFSSISGPNGLGQDGTQFIFTYSSPGGSNRDTPGGGGGGAGITDLNTSAYAGGLGGLGFPMKKALLTQAAGGAAGGAVGSNGSTAGDGGGGGSSNPTGAGFAGGNGAFPGGGGGGGGASLNGFASGAGGNGANGVVRVWSW